MPTAGWPIAVLAEDMRFDESGSLQLHESPKVIFALSETVIVHCMARSVMHARAARCSTESRNTKSPHTLNCR